MNNSRRKQLEKAISLAQEALDIIRDCHNEEEDCYDNLPESFQYGEKGEAMQEMIDSMETCILDIENALDNLNNEVVER